MVRKWTMRVVEIHRHLYFSERMRHLAQRHNAVERRKTGSTPLLLIAVGLGATIATAMNDNVTHVLARSDNTEKVKWGRKRGLFIVNGNWLRECAMQKRKLDEHNFATLQ